MKTIQAAIAQTGAIKTPRKNMSTRAFVRWFVRKGESTSTGIQHKKAYLKYRELKDAEEVADRMLGLSRSSSPEEIYEYFLKTPKDVALKNPYIVTHP